MNCPACGAALGSAMIEAGDCGYCGSALPRERPAPEPPRVVHVTRVEVSGPRIEVGGLFDSLSARLAGCFTGCLSTAMTVGITGMILAFVAWQLWTAAKQATPHPAPAPIEHARPVKRH